VTTISDLEALKRKTERMRQEHDRAQGRLDEAQKRLKQEFQVDSIEEAEQLLKKMTKKEESAREAFEEAMTAFNKEWGDKLE